MSDPDAQVKRRMPGFGYSDRPMPMETLLQPTQGGAQHQGYHMPEEQFKYDTAYHGGLSERALS